MQIATILPIAHLALEAESGYHMCLAHLMDDPEYRKFFEWQAAAGKHVIMDNGVVEVGTPLHIWQLMNIAKDAGITEMTLPDRINDRITTLHLHKSAMDILETFNPEQKVMLIPQGCDRENWIESVRNMLDLAAKYSNQVTAIGISKFSVNRTHRDGNTKLFDSRLEALLSVPLLLESDLQIHLLGCPDSPKEIREIDMAFPDRIRGVDSGLPVFYTMHGGYLKAGAVRPIGKELDFDAKFKDENLSLLKENIHTWKEMIFPKQLRYKQGDQSDYVKDFESALERGLA